jgi:hypothetical protein
MGKFLKKKIKRVEKSGICLQIAISPVKGFKKITKKSPMACIVSLENARLTPILPIDHPMFNPKKTTKK